MVTNKVTKRISGVVAVVAMIAIVAVATVGGSSDAHAGDMRPFKGSANGILTGPNSGEGTVTATHIGKGTVEFSGLLLNFAAGSPDPTPAGPNICFPVYGGDQTFTAANGDELNMEYRSGRFCVDMVTQLPVYGNFGTTVTNGTGRFEDAVGSIWIDAVGIDVDGNPGFVSTFVGDSWIHY